jgi:hypothetical protein
MSKDTNVFESQGIFDAFISNAKAQIALHEQQEQKQLREVLRCVVTTHCGKTYEFLGRIHKAHDDVTATMQCRKKKTDQPEYPWYEVRVLQMPAIINADRRQRSNSNINVVMPIHIVRTNKMIINHPKTITSIDEAILYWQSWCIVCIYSMIDNTHTDYQAVFEKIILDHDERTAVLLGCNMSHFDPTNAEIEE